jgi:hypothetical protein
MTLLPTARRILVARIGAFAVGLTSASCAPDPVPPDAAVEPPDAWVEPDAGNDGGTDAAPPPPDAHRPTILVSYSFSGTGPEVEDRSGNGHTGTLVGATLESGVLRCEPGQYLDGGPFSIPDGYTVRFDLSFGRQYDPTDLASDDDHAWISLEGDLIGVAGTGAGPSAIIGGPTLDGRAWHRVAISKFPDGRVLFRVDERVQEIRAGLGPAPLDHLRLCPSRPGRRNGSWIELDNFIVLDEAVEQPMLLAL